MVAERLSRAPREHNGDVWVVVSQATKDPILVKVQEEEQQNEELADFIKYLENKDFPNCEMRL